MRPAATSTFLCEVAEAVVEAGATTVNLPDTVGYALPEDITRMFIAVGRASAPTVTLSAHCHDDLGMAVANSLAAVQAGARQVECTINGIGERAGNASLEEIVMALHVRRDRLCFETAIRTPEITATSQLLSEIVGVAVPPNKAIVGANAFAHEAGIHQDGVLKNPLTYEILRPGIVGAPGTRLVLGKHSGTRGVDARCRALGFACGRSARARLCASGRDGRHRQDDRGFSHRRGRGCRPHGGRPGAQTVRLRIAVLPGDGIGPEVTAQAVRVLQLVGDACGHEFECHELPIGGAALRHAGTPSLPHTLDGCLASHAVLLGAVGDPAFDHLAARAAAGSGVAATAPRARRVCQSAAGAHRASAGRRHAVSARTRCGRRHA